MKISLSIVYQNMKTHFLFFLILKFVIASFMCYIIQINKSSLWIIKMFLIGCVNFIFKSSDIYARKCFIFNIKWKFSYILFDMYEILKLLLLHTITCFHLCNYPTTGRGVLLLKLVDGRCPIQFPVALADLAVRSFPCFFSEIHVNTG